MICTILLYIGITMTCEAPTQPDAAAIELQSMQDEMRRQEQQADEKLLHFYGGRGVPPTTPKPVTGGDPS